MSGTLNEHMGERGGLEKGQSSFVQKKNHKMGGGL